MVRKMSSAIIFFFCMSMNINATTPVEDFAEFPSEYSFENTQTYSNSFRRKVFVIAATAVIGAVLYYKYQDIKKSVKNFLNRCKNPTRTKEKSHQISCHCSCLQRLGSCPCLKNQGICECRC
jgi:hypothetical protein